MELRQLRYFLAAANELHFGRAARAMHIKQPSLTQQIQRLEADLGVRLFDRNSHQVQLTEAGEFLREKADRVVRQARKAEETVHRLDQGGAEPAMGRTLQVGFTCPAARRLLPGALRTLRARNPSIDVELHDLWSGQQVTAVLAGELDIAFVLGPVRDERLRTRTLLREALVALLPARHPLAAETRVSLRALASEPLVFFQRELSPALHNQVHSRARGDGVWLDMRHSVSHPSAIPLLVAAGHAVALTTAARAALAADPGLVTRELDGAGLTVELVMVWRTGPQSRPVRAMIDAVDSVSDAMASVLDRAAGEPREHGDRWNCAS
jgi:DNA-binding transcriptional LysR family regulator